MKRGVWVLMAVMLVAVVAGCVETISPKEKTTPSNSDDLFFKSINMSIDGTPTLNQPVTMTIEVNSPVKNISNATLEILLPEGFELVSGNLKWQGNLQKNEIIILNLTIKAIKTGDYAIQFLATANSAIEFHALQTKFLYVSVSEFGAEVSDIKIISKQEIVKMEVADVNSLKANTTDIPAYSKVQIESVNSSKNISVVTAGGTINVYGYFYFRSDTDIGECYYDSGANAYDCPIRQAKVQLFDQDPLNEVWLADGYTDTDGFFYFGNIPNDDGLFENGLDIFVKVHATYWNPSTDGVYVTDGNIFDISYWARAPNEGNLGDRPDGNVDVGSWVVTDASKRGSWAIYEWDLRAYEYLKSRVSWSQPKIEVIWSPTATEGPYFETHYDIHIPAGFEWDLDVNQHEYGHAVMWKLYGNAFPPTSFSGDHFLEKETDGGFALIEGWAEFLPEVIQNSSDYRDWNMETEHFEEDSASGYGDFDGDKVEGAVATVLWDISDDASAKDDGSPYSDDDGIPNKFDKLWTVIKDHKPSDINQIWDGWFDIGHNYGYRNEMNSIFWDHHIDKNNPPTCTISSPNGGGWYRSTITVSATASDTDGTVSKVKFQYSQDGTNWYNIETDPSSAGGWSYSWDTNSITDSSVWVRCQANDSMEWGEFDQSDSSFGVDNTAPTNPSSYTSSHTVNQWSTDNTIDMTWSGASDSHSGLAGYYYLWDTSPSTVPTTSNSYTTSTSATIPALGDSSSYYFHVRAKDNAGNLNSGAYHVGPFKIDASAPSSPTGVSASPSVWTSTNSFSVDWTNPSDTSGIAGAYYKFDSLPAHNTDGTYTTGKPITGISVSADGSHPVYIWLKDGAGNIDYNNRGSTTLYYDGTSPSSPSSIVWDDGSQSPDTTIVANWGDVTDTSGTVDYYLQVDEDSTDFTSCMIFDSLIGSSTSTKTLTNSNGVTIGHTYYYRVKAKNGAGLLGDWSAASEGVLVQSGNNPPNLPASLAQYESDGVTAIPIGGETDESTVVMKGTVSDPDGDNVQLEVEARTVGTSFSDTPNCISGSAVSSGSTASAACGGLSNGQYHWQARARDSNGAAGSWQSAGGNPESNADFTVNAADTAPPAIIDSSPTGTNVPANTQITVTFSEAMNQSSTQSAFSTSPAIAGSFNWSSNTMTFIPGSNLSYSTNYTVTIGTGAEDLAGNSLQMPYSWQFTTTSFIPPVDIISDPTKDWFTGNGTPATGYDYTDIISTKIEKINFTHLKAITIVNASIPDFGWHGYRWFLDTDRSNTTGQTGYLFNDIGADYHVEVAGNSGVPNPSIAIWKWTPAGFELIRRVTDYSVTGNKVEITFSLADIGNPDSFYWVADSTDGISVNDHAPNVNHAAFTTPKPVPVNWTKYSGNPLTDLGDNIGSPSVILDGTNYKMWYYCESGYGICYATSYSGLNWTTHGKVLTNGTTNWESRVSAPNVMFDGALYKMWYVGSDMTDNARSRVFYASSSNGINWIKYSSDPVLNVGGNGGWDDWNIYNPKVVFNGTHYLMLYAAQAYIYQYPHGTGLATSADGINWTKYPDNPVFPAGNSGSWDDNEHSPNSLIFDGTTYHLWYSANRGASYQRVRIGYANSTDGINWARYPDNPVLSHGNSGEWDSESASNGAVIFDSAADTYKMWYTGYDGSVHRIGYAYSGTAPTPVPTISSCTTISSPGTYMLNRSIVNSSASKCIEITSSNVIFDGAGYTIDGKDTWTTYSVHVYNSTISLTNVTVKNLKVTDWSYGISYQNVQNGYIINNIANSNSFGIYLNYSTNNRLNDNNASNNQQKGIYLYSSTNNLLSANNASNNIYGINLAFSSNNTLNGNNALNNIMQGIHIDSSSNYNTLHNNNALNNMNGILLYSSNNTLSGNTVLTH